MNLPEKTGKFSSWELSLPVFSGKFSSWELNLPDFSSLPKKHSSSLKYRPPSRTDYKMSPTSQPRHEKNVRREADSNPHSSRTKCMRELTPQPTELSDHIILIYSIFHLYISNILSY